MRTFARKLALILCLSLIVAVLPLGLQAKAAEDTAYYAVMEQAKLGKTLYFSGTMDGYYLATTEDAEAAAVLYKEASGDGFKLYFYDGEVKKYINLTDRGSGKANVEINESTGAVFTMLEAANTPVTEVAGNQFYLGTYNEYKTFSASSTSYITGDNASKVDVSQFPLRLVEIEAAGGDVEDETVATEPTEGTLATEAPAAKDEYEIVTNPKADVAYLAGLVQNNLDGKTLYFSGIMDGNFLATTEDPAAAVELKLEAVDGGYYLYFVKDGAKTYINYNEYDKGNGKYGCRLSLTAEAPAIALTYNSDWNTMVIDCAQNDYTLGTYQSFATISASSTYYIEGDKSADIGVTQFLMRFYAASEAKEDNAPTGDNAVIMPVIIVMIVAVELLALVVFKRNKF